MLKSFQTQQTTKRKAYYQKHKKKQNTKWAKFVVLIFDDLYFS
jgi:hypothetical protein